MPGQMTWLFFGFSGRISRAAYFLSGLLMMIIVVFLTYQIVRVQEAGGGGETWQAVLSMVLLASLWAQAALSAKRIHDLGRPGILAALLFIPLVNFIVFVALCVIPGNPGPNRYGEVTNAPNSVGGSS